MRMPRTISIAFLSACVFLSAQAAHAGDGVRTGTREGERFPDLNLPSIANGKMVSLSSFRGKKVLLLKFASW